MLPFKDLGAQKFSVTLPVNLDFEVHKFFRDTLREIMQCSPKELTFDFSDVDYIDSAGLGMLMLARKEASTNNCKLMLTNVGEGHPRKVLEMVKFDSLFNIEFV